MPQEYPEQSYYPGAKLRLTFRLDEFGNANRLKPVPSKTTKNLTGTRDPRGALQAVLDPQAPQGTTRYLIVEQGATQAQDAPSQSRSSDGLTFDVTVIPKEMSWDQNGIRTADTLSATFKLIDCPIDPRTARSVAVEGFLGSVSGEEFYAGIQGQVRSGIGVQSAGESLNVIPDTYLDQNRKQRTNSRFLGWVDKWNIEYEEEAEPVIRIDCRDNTQLFIEQQAPPRLVLDMSSPIDKAIAVYLSHFPQMQGLTVQYLPQTDSPPVLKDVLLNTAYRPNLGPQPSKGGGNDKLSVWDYLTDVCGSIGHLIRVQGTTIIVQRPRAVVPGTPQPRVDDPFQGRTLATGEELTYRRFILGKNIKTMHISRNYAKNTPTNIEIRCFIPETKVEALDIEKAYRREYSGPTVRATAQGSRVLTGTPNHPVLTARGWVALGELVEGDDLVCSSFAKGICLGYPYVDASPTEFAKLFDALSNASNPYRRTSRNVDFHGDGRDADVEIVSTDLLLTDETHAARTKHSRKFSFKISSELLGALKSAGASDSRAFDLLRSALDPSAVHVRGSRDVSFFRGRHLLEPQLTGKLVATKNNTLFDQFSSQRVGMTDTDFFRESFYRGTLFITTSKVLKIERGEYHGPVYNLQTASGWYVASGVVVHNCFDTERKTLLVERFPLPEDRLAYAIPGDAQPDQKWLVRQIYGIKDKKTLKIIAQSYYEQIGRNELQIEVKTRNLSSFGGGNLDPDILDMQAGDTFEVLINRSDDESSTVTNMETALTIQQKNAQYMTNLGFQQDFANAYAKAYTDAGFLPQWRLKNMKVTWSEDQGIDIALTGANYIEVRSNQSLPDGQEPSTQDPTQPQVTTINQPAAVNAGQTSDSLPNQTTPDKWPPF